jgi:hypothetical protein
MIAISNDLKSLFLYVSPNFYESFFFNTLNYLIILISLLFFYKKKNININIFVILAFLSLTPFVLNNVIFDWHRFPDQSKYLNQSRELRENFLFFYKDIVLNKINYFFASLVIFNLETFSSIGFINRFCFNLLIIFLIKKKSVNEISVFLLLLYPSIIFQSSISLKDVYILILNIIYLYFLIKNKVSYRFCGLLISLLLLFSIAPENFFLTILVTFLYLFYKINNFNFKLIILFILIIFIIFYSFNEFFFNIINNNIIKILDDRRRGYFVENFGLYKDSFSPEIYKNYYSLTNLDFLKIVLLLKHFIYFLIAPLIIVKLDTFSLLMFVDEIFILLVLFYSYIKFKKNNKKIYFFWIFIILINSFFYSLIIFNEGTMFRYRFIFLSYSIFAMNLELINKKT